MAVWHKAPQIFDGFTLFQNHALCIENDQVTASCASGSLPFDATVVQHSGLLAPGLFDIQVNGGGGVLFNTSPSVDGIATICAAHRTLGTTALFPTVITDTANVLEAAAKACLDARNLPGMMGIHIEGPHISKTRRGTHEEALIRPLDEATFGVVRELREEGLPVLITLAPEAATQAQVEEMVSHGAIVSLGHSDATAPEARMLLEAGATAFTHLFNAMSQMQGRKPGVVGAAINSNAYCSIIADGIHVDPDMVQLAFRARPKPDRMIAISDAMPTVGGPDKFNLYGREIALEKGRLVNSEGSLAGAHLTALDAVRNLVGYGIPLEIALRSARHNPASLMGLWPDMKLIGSRADHMLVLSPDLELLSIGLQ